MATPVSPSRIILIIPEIYKAMNQPNNKRVSALFFLFILISGILGWRLFQKQVLDHASYMAQAEGQYATKQDLPASRGKIYSSDMYPLATNDRLYQLIVVPRYIPTQNKPAVAQKIAALFNEDTNTIFQEINNDKYYIPPLHDHLSEADGQKVTDLKIKGVMVAPENIRSYPEGQLASHILGFVDSSANGHYGLEGFYNEELKGISGQVNGNRDVKGQIFDISSQTEAQNGDNLVLTIDRKIQYQAEQVLAEAVSKYEADNGSIIISDPNTGAILAMADDPTFDPNNYNKVATEGQSVFNNMAINNAWEPGSVFKPLIMAAAIDQGLVQPDTKNTFGESVKVDSYTIETSTRKAYGEETMTQVLENSDNVAMVWISNLLGKDNMYKYIKSFGFGRKSGVEMDTESAGSVADPKNWSHSQQATIAFGQGITATPLQILMATSAMANGGKLMQPYIVDKTVKANGQISQTQPKVITQVIRVDTANKVNQMMVAVVDNGHGRPARVTGYSIAGKTGTAQVPNPGGGYYPDRFDGSFVGFAPANNPKFAMIIRMDNPKAVAWAEDSAAPAFGQMAKWLFSYMGIAPDRPVAQ